VIVPEELRPRQEERPQIVINAEPLPEISSSAIKKGALAIGGFTLASILLPLIFTCVIIVVVGVIILVVTQSAQTALQSAVGGTGSGTPNSDTGSSLIQLGPTPTPTFATVAMKFGSEGIGSGQFKDARHVATDSSGNIYVAEYIGGRIQIFDSSGKYQTEWDVDRKAPLTGFAVSRKGVAYVVQGGKIEQHDGMTGKLIASLSYKNGNWFDDAWLQPNGGLVTAWYDNSDDLVLFDPQGHVTKVIKAAISTVTGDDELDTRVAGDGSGNIYAMGSFNSAVFKFSPDGKYQNKFGSEGDNPGQFAGLLAVAVDGQGRVYVSDIKGIQVFSPDGQYQALIGVDSAAYGLSVDDANHLWVAEGTQIVEYTLPGQ
jgi:streptogramin lyase